MYIENALGKVLKKAWEFVQSSRGKPRDKVKGALSYLWEKPNILKDAGQGASLGRLWDTMRKLFIFLRTLIFFPFLFFWTFYFILEYNLLLVYWLCQSLCVDHNKLWKILKEMGIPGYLTCLLRNLYAGQKTTVRNGHGTTDWERSMSRLYIVTLLI